MTPLIDWVLSAAKDPVWAGVFSAVIVAALAATIKPFRQALGGLVRGIRTLFTVSAELEVITGGQFPHAPWLRINVRNRSLRRVRLTSLAFTTKNAWAIPELRRMGETRDVFPLLGRPPLLAVISHIRATVAQLPLNQTLRAFDTVDVQVRLVTTHSPNDGFGLFPFHLGVALTWADGTKTRPLSDIVVSLHGKTPISMIEYGAHFFGYEPANERQDANSVLVAVNAGAATSPEIAKWLGSLIGQKPALAARAGASRPEHAS